VPGAGYSAVLNKSRRRLRNHHKTLLTRIAQQSTKGIQGEARRPPPSPRLRPYKALPRPSRPDRPALVAPEIKGTESRGPVAFAALRIVAQYSPPPGPCPIEKEDERNPMFGWGKGT